MAPKEGFRPNIWSKWAKGKEASKVMSFIDNLHLHKIQVTATESGKDSVRAYIGMHTANAIATAIVNGTFGTVYKLPQPVVLKAYTVVAQHQVYGGKPSSRAYGGRPESRIFTIEQIVPADGGAPKFRIDVKVGEGVVTSQGAIQPKDQRNMISQSMFFSLPEIYEMASALLVHINAYYARNFVNLFDANGDPISVVEADGLPTVSPFFSKEHDA